MAWAYQKDSEFVECFNYHMHKADESGLLHHLQKELLKNRNHDADADDNGGGAFNVLGYENLSFPCLMLLAGMILAMLNVLAEWLWNTIKTKRNPDRVGGSERQERQQTNNENQQWQNQGGRAGSEDGNGRRGGSWWIVMKERGLELEQE